MTSDTPGTSDENPSEPQRPPTRFIISHRMAPYRDGRARRSAKGNFSDRLMRRCDGYRQR